MIRRHINNPATLPCHSIPMRTQGYAGNSLRSCEADLGDEHKFGKYSFCGTLHYCNSCVFRNTKCGKIGHIQAIRNTITSPNRSLWILLFFACGCIHWSYTRKCNCFIFSPRWWRLLPFKTLNFLTDNLKVVFLSSPTQESYISAVVQEEIGKLYELTVSWNLLLYVDRSGFIHIRHCFNPNPAIQKHTGTFQHCSWRGFEI